ncbi:MAG TPA: HlyD family efflux transporter periplasmic adaptor subunit, partial [Flavisolibacter sp.]|nr:HlyD family efflux transporter periplasmic adaptor subunit [Flavisolibacter sp.]
MKINRSYFLGFICILGMTSCKHKAAAEKDPEEAPAGAVQTPVTVTKISNEPMSDSIELNATSSFLQDNVVKSNINGYVQSVQVKPGQFAHLGQLLFTLKTKEAESLGNTINKLDPTFHFSGIVKIVATQSGFVTGLLHQVGDYVQDGEQLAVISDSKSFGFLLNVPYEYSKYVSLNKTVQVLLPDGTILDGRVSAHMPVIDSVS